MTRIEALAIPMLQAAQLDIYSGVARLSGKLWASHHVPDGPRPQTVVAAIHPSSNFLGHYLLEPLARHGVAAVGLNTRYIANDSALIMENCVLDVAASIRYLRDLGYERVILLGNSGGGGLAALYQSQSERPTITQTPAGDPPDLTQFDLPGVDALIMLMAHPGRAAVYTEWLDAAVIDEADPFDRDRSLDMFDSINGPPYGKDFLNRYREAQVARNRRITAWVREHIAGVSERTGGQVSNLPFVVHGTTADPRFLDLSIDPSDRTAGTLWGDPHRANLIPATLGHLTSLRSWLSQWSIDDTNCDGPRHLQNVSVPVQVIFGTADMAAFPSHARSLHDAVPHDDRELVPIAGANHYFQGQSALLEECCERIRAWLDMHHLL